jgi:hypothetical protein
VAAPKLTMPYWMVTPSGEVYSRVLPLSPWHVPVPFKPCSHSRVNSRMFGKQNIEINLEEEATCRPYMKTSIAYKIRMLDSRGHLLVSYHRSDLPGSSKIYPMFSSWSWHSMTRQWRDFFLGLQPQLFSHFARKDVLGLIAHQYNMYLDRHLVTSCSHSVKRQEQSCCTGKLYIKV